MNLPSQSRHVAGEGRGTTLLLGVEESIDLGQTSLRLAAALQVEVEQRRALMLHDAHGDGLLGSYDQAAPRASSSQSCWRQAL